MRPSPGSGARLIISGYKIHAELKLTDHADSRRLIAEAYERRNAARAGRLYDCFSPGALYLIQAQERSWLRLLGRLGFGGGRLKYKKIYEIGCGSGGILAKFLDWGAAPENLSGCELSPERAAEARRRLPAAVAIETGDAAASVGQGGNDLVFCGTVLSSIASPEHRRAVAETMWRLTAPGGWAVSYDLRYGNPANPDVSPVTAAELTAYFPEAAESFGRCVLLVPPLARRLAPFGFWLCDLLNLFPFLRGHLLAAFRRPSDMCGLFRGNDGNDGRRAGAP